LTNLDMRSMDMRALYMEHQGKGGIHCDLDDPKGSALFPRVDGVSISACN